MSTRRPWLVLGGLVAAGLCAAAVCEMTARDDPPPLWTTADLPRLPSPAGNGWAYVVNATHDRSIETDPIESDLWFVVGEMKHDETWERVAEGGETLEATIREFEASEAYGVWRHAAAMDVFADGCPPKIESRCATFQVFKLARASILRILLAGHQQRWSDASSAMHELLELAVEYQSSARNLLAQSASAALLKLAVQTCAALVWRASQADVDTEELRDFAANLEFKEDLERAIIFDYVVALDALESFGSEEWVGPEPSGWSIFYSRARTIRRLNEIYPDMMRFAAGDGPPEPAPEPTDCTLSLDRISCELVRFFDSRSSLPGIRNRILEDLEEARAAQRELLR